MPKSKSSSKKKKTLPPLPPFFDYTTYTPPQWTPPAPAHFTTLAADHRRLQHSTLTHHQALIRLRQVDWEDFHDAYVVVEKGWSVFRVQRVVSEQVHGGAVEAGDVVVYLGEGGKDARERESGGVGEGAEGDGGGGGVSTAVTDGMGGSTGNVMRTGSEVTVGSPTTPATTQDTTGSGSSPPHDHPITHPRPSATPTARLDACFPSIASFVMPSDPDPDSQTRLALSHLPPGLSLSTHTLHALLTDAARRAFAKSSANLVPQDTRATGRRMTLTAGNSNAPRRQSMMLLGPRRMSVMGDVNNPGGGGEAVGAPAAVVLPAAVTVWYDVALNMGPRGPPTPSAATAPVNVRTRSGAERERGKENVRPASGRSDTSGKGARPASARSDVSGKGFGPSGGTDVGIAITTTTTATITSDQDRSPRHRLDHTDPLLMYETYRVKTARGAGTSVGGGDKARGGSPPATGKATADAGPAAVQQPQPQPQPQPQTQAPALPPPSSGKGRKKAREGVPMVTFIEEGEGE